MVAMLGMWGAGVSVQHGPAVNIYRIGRAIRRRRAALSQTRRFSPARIRATAVSVSVTSTAIARWMPRRRSPGIAITAPSTGMPTVTATRWLVVMRPVASPLLASGIPAVAVTVAATTAVIWPKEPPNSAGISNHSQIGAEPSRISGGRHAALDEQCRQSADLGGLSTGGHFADRGSR